MNCKYIGKTKSVLTSSISSTVKTTFNFDITAARYASHHRNQDLNQVRYILCGRVPRIILHSTSSNHRRRTIHNTYIKQSRLRSCLFCSRILIMTRTTPVQSSSQHAPYLELISCSNTHTVRTSTSSTSSYPVHRTPVPVP